MKKLLCLSAGLVAMSVFCATAEQAAPPPIPGAEGAPAVKKEGKPQMPPMPAVKELALSGTVVKEERTNKKGEATSFFVLQCDDGTKLQLPTAGKADAPAFKLEDYVGAKVRVTGTGYEKERNGKKLVALRKIATIDKVGDAPAAAPAK